MPLDTWRGENMMDFSAEAHCCRVTPNQDSFAFHLIDRTLCLGALFSTDHSVLFRLLCSWFIRHKFYSDSLMPFLKHTVLFHGLPNVTITFFFLSSVIKPWNRDISKHANRCYTAYTKPVNKGVHHTLIRYTITDSISNTRVYFHKI